MFFVGISVGGSRGLLGKLRQYHLVAPVLDKCAACITEDPNPLCMTGCPAAALIVGQFEDVVKEAAERHCAIFTA